MRREIRGTELRPLFCSQIYISSLAPSLSRSPPEHHLSYRFSSAFPFLPRCSLLIVLPLLFQARSFFTRTRARASTVVNYLPFDNPLVRHYAILHAALSSPICHANFTFSRSPFVFFSFSFSFFLFPPDTSYRRPFLPVDRNQILLPVTGIESRRGEE